MKKYEKGIHVKDLTGMRFGLLTVSEFAYSEKWKSFWLCECDCGGEKIVRAHNLKGGTGSCGCAHHNRSHMLSKTKFYKIWSSMKDRCNNKNNKFYYRYGGRGIKVCERWHKFENFRDDMYEDYLKGKATIGDCQLDRRDNDKGYFKENCHWVSRKENCINRGQSKSVLRKLTSEQAREVKRLYSNGSSRMELSEMFNVSIGIIRRVVLGISYKDII